MSTTPTVPVGPTTILGVLSTIIAAAGAIVAAVQANDTATIAASVVTILTAVTTLGGRFAQAVELIRKGATYAQPTVDEVAADPATPPVA